MFTNFGWCCNLVDQYNFVFTSIFCSLIALQLHLDHCSSLTMILNLKLWCGCACSLFLFVQLSAWALQLPSIVLILPMDQHSRIRTIPNLKLWCFSGSCVFIDLFSVYFCHCSSFHLFFCGSLVSYHSCLALVMLWWLH